MKIQVESSIVIAKPAHEIYAIIADLEQWDAWSPWKHTEPDSKTEVKGQADKIGQTLEWNGEVTGTGKMTVIELQKGRGLKTKIEFFKPWKSQSEATFALKEAATGQTDVTWSMQGELPWFMFLFKNMMTAYMRADFERGLRMLKDLAETGTVSCRSVYLGAKVQNGFQILGRKKECHVRDLPQMMRSEFSQFQQLIENGDIAKPERMGALHHVFDMQTGDCKFTAGMIYELGVTVRVPRGYELTQIPSHNGLRVDQHGPYRHLGNGWTMMSIRQRTHKLKSHSDIPEYEIYVTVPDGRPESELYTQLCTPLK